MPTQEYTMTERVLSRITTAQGKPPHCRICGETIEIGERVVATRGRYTTHRHKNCFENSFIEVSQK